ncbi:efflux ABC transporter, permease protein [Streptococcus parasanguinis F0405]|uniref:Efflux ABC transporter, permease protein n=1 Tax=Streptococcus parasanguinis F0405 TaxID=905067 RepID=E3CD95_STRPA|nr:ABC transporter permease [Streptococcus parasanguinis]EFQ55361.1 efflux ABC transporter, permease protein [Streptococcus parasanguinis F0405]
MLLQQAIAYISRKRTRNLVLFLILLLILSCLYFCFSLMQVGGMLEDHIKQSAGTSFALTSKQGATPFALKEAEKVKELSEVGDMVPQYESPVRILGKEAVTGQQSVERDDLGQEAKQALGAVFTQKTDQHLDFRSGSFQLVQGKHLSEKARGQILIHQELAKKNNLKVGDSLTLSSFQMGETPAKEQTFKIVGIFSGKKQEKFTGMTSDLSENQVYLPYEDATKLLGLGQQEVTQVTFGVKDPEKIDALLKQVKSLDLDWQSLRVVEDRKAFDQMKESSQTLEGLVRIMMIVLLVTGAGALSLLLSLWTRERIHEIGVLLSIGKSKGRIFGQFLLEVVLVSLLALIPAFLIGRMISHRFLEQFVGQTGQQQTLELLHQIPQGLSLGIAYASLLCLILLSLGATTSMIWRKTPKEILTKMS